MRYFWHYESMMVNSLSVPTDRSVTYLWIKLAILSLFLDQLWEYRFLHRDLGHLLEESPRLRGSYRQFARKVMAQAYILYNALRKAQLIKATEQDIQAMIVNIWILTTSWASFVVSSGFFGEEVDVKSKLA
jgi:hypothetical protein